MDKQSLKTRVDKIQSAQSDTYPISGFGQEVTFSLTRNGDFYREPIVVKIELPPLNPQTCSRR